MKLKIKAVLLAFPVALCGGCGSEQPRKEVTFTDGMQKDLTEKMKVDAQFVYPQSCKNGIGLQAELGDKLFWDRQDEIAELLFQNRTVVNEYTDDYGSEKYKTYEAGEDGAMLLISSNNYLTYSTDQAVYINNVLSFDTRFDDYNGDKFQKRTDLDFMPQKEAWEKVSMILDELGVETSETVTCFVMDHGTMEEEEEAAIARAISEDTKIPMEKAQWTEEDDCYYFKTRAAWKGYTVLPVMMGEGYDEDNISVVYDKNGIVLLYINGYYPLKDNREIILKTPEEAVKRLEEYLKNIISDDFYEVRKIALCQKVMRMNSGSHTAEIVPVWECSVQVKSGDPSDRGYIQKIYFRADTLEVAI